MGKLKHLQAVDFQEEFERLSDEILSFFFERLLKVR
jgi:hypothetical protein